MPDGEQVSGEQGGAGEQEAPTFETYYEGLDESLRGVLDSHMAGLKNALQSERQQRGELAKQFKDLAGKAEKGSELETQLREVSTRLEAAERRAAFFEESAKPEIGCTNPRLALVLAEAEGYFTRNGAPDWGQIRASAPELFRKAGPGSADGGAGNGRPVVADMNAMIRRAAGR